MNDGPRDPARGHATVHPGDETPWAERLEAALPLAEEVMRCVIAARRLPPSVSEEFLSRARLHLVEDDYRVLRRFQGRCQLRTYLVTVLSRLAVDVLASELGRFRPSAEAERIGPVAMRLEECLYRDGLAPEEAFRTCQGAFRDTSVDELRRLAARLPMRLPRRFEGDAALRDRPAGGPDPEEALLAQERFEASARTIAWLRQELERLPAEDRLLLQWHYEDGLTISAVARLLRTPQRKLYDRFTAIRSALRKRLEGRERQADGPDSPGNSAARPSKPVA